MATTIKLIRDQQASLIKALTPSSLAGKPFREYTEAGDFRDWSEASPKASLRRFQIVDEFDYEEPQASNQDSEEVVTTMTVTVAYPNDARYGRLNDKEQRDVVREDMHQIDTAIGIRGSSGYVSGQNAAVARDKELEEGETVRFLTMRYEINFRRAM